MLCWTKHYFGTKNIVGEIKFNRKTGKDIKLLVGQCLICNKRETMIVSDNRIPVEGLSSFFQIIGRSSARAGKKVATNILKNPGRPLETTSNIATSALSKKPNNLLSTLPEVMNFYHTGTSFYLGKFVEFMPYSWKRTKKFYPSATLLSSDQDLEHRLEKNLKYVNSFNISKKNIKGMITYFKDKNHKSKTK